MRVYRTALADPERSAKYYEFSQNNSGGSFDFDEELGITTRVFIEAYDAVDANHRAERIGIYFDGIDSGQDCACCGDRWYSVEEPWREAILEENLGEHILELMTFKFHMKWQKPDKPEIFVHKMDGTLVGFDYGDETDLDFLKTEEAKKETKELEGGV